MVKENRGFIVLIRVPFFVVAWFTRGILTKVKHVASWDGSNSQYSWLKFQLVRSKSSKCGPWRVVYHSCTLLASH